MKDTCYVLLHRPTQFRLNVIPSGDPGRRTILSNGLMMQFPAGLLSSSLQTDLYLQDNPPPRRPFLLKLLFCFDIHGRVSVFPLIISHLHESKSGQSPLPN